MTLILTRVRETRYEASPCPVHNDDDHSLSSFIQIVTWRLLQAWYYDDISSLLYWLA